MSQMCITKISFRKIFLGITLFIIIIWLVLYFCFPSGLVMSLPSGVDEIYEQTSSSGLDYVHIVKAKMSIEQYNAWCKKKGFTPAPTNLKEHVVWQANWAKEWWDPTQDVDTTLYNPDFIDWEDPEYKGDDYSVVKYENGYLYYIWQDI